MRLRENVSDRRPVVSLPYLGLLTAAVFFVANAVPAASPVADAARAGNFDELSLLIESGTDVDVTAGDGSTALLWAVYRGDVAMVEALIAAGADPNVANNYGVFPLLQASRSGDAELIELLLAAGADPMMTHTEGETPLMAAARTGNVAAVELLLASGVDVNATDSFQNQTALMWASAEGHIDVVGALLNAGADPDVQARVSEISERSINTDFPSGGFTAVMWAARNGYQDVVEALAGAGADLNLTNADGATATMISIVNDRFDLAARLVELGADVNDGSLYHAVEMRDATTDWYARDGSRLRANHDNELTALDLIERFLEQGADPNTVFVGQMHSSTMCCDSFANATPLYRAAMAADVSALELLIAHGGDITWMPENVEGGGGRANANVGRAAILAAVSGGKGVPLSAGPGYSREGPPPFREPSNREPADAVKLLVDAGADPNAVMPDGGNTALHQAVQSRNLDTIRVLAEAGAKLDAKNEKGLTALHVAEGLPSEAQPFGPQLPENGAKPEEIVALLTELMTAAGVPIEPAPPEEAEDSDAG
jgi:ankyrin repeat protein